MKLKFTSAYIAFAMICLTACSHGHEEHDRHTAETESEEHDHEGVILLTEEQVTLLGVKAEPVSPGKFANVIKVSGEITAMPGSEGVVAARQSGIVHIAKGITPGIRVAAGSVIAHISAKAMSGGDPNESARVAYESARRELDRITPLHREGIVSTKDYNSALQRVEETKAAMGAGAARYGAATSPVSGVISTVDVADGEFVNTGQTIATISSNNAMTLRADLPESEASMAGGISNARFRPSYSSETVDVAAAGGRLISGKAIAKSADGYIPLYFSLPYSGGKVISGTYCEVYLLGAETDGVISVPESAVSEQQGNYFVYVEETPGHYRKMPVTLGRNDGSRREIITGLNAGQKVVTEGMTYVRLAETSGVVPEGHSHNH